MADKKYRVNFRMSDGTTKSIEFTAPQGEQGIQGIQGIQGDTGAAIEELILVGQDADGGNVYRMTFDNGIVTNFTAPRGEQGLQGEKGERGEKGEDCTEELKTKVDKSELNSVLYATDENGNDSTIDYSHEATPNSIPCRDENTGAVAVGEPTDDNHAARLIDVTTAINTEIQNLINNAPETLDTLNELAVAISDNADLVETLNSAIGDKADKSYVDDAVESVGIEVIRVGY